MEKSILFVDDEIQILKALKRLFMQSDYRIFLAESGEEALQILQREKIDLLATDMRMPGMDGYKLLTTVKEKYPGIIRLIVSGYADEKLIIKAIESGYARMYLLKPWDNDYFRGVIDQMFEIKAVLDGKSLFQTISSIQSLPSAPLIYEKLRKLIEDDANMAEVANLIEQDQSIAAKVLHVANTAFYGARTGSIKQAVMYLGLANLKNIVLTTVLYNSLNLDIDPRVFNKDLLWKHASLTNRLVSLFYEKLLNTKVKEICASAGLLHDIGKIALIHCNAKAYEAVIRTAVTEKTDFIDAENRILGSNHEEIGGYLLNWWGIPYPIVEIALFHHVPLSEKVMNKELACIVHIADYYSWKLLDQNIVVNAEADAFTFLKTSKEQCDELADTVKIEQLF